MSLITEKYVDEDYKFTSTNKDEFYSFLKENDVHTKNCKIRSDMVTILALRHDCSFHGESIPMWRIMPEKPMAVARTMDVSGKRQLVTVNERFSPMDIPKRVLMEKGDFNDFVKKVIESKEILFYMDMQVCYLSKRAIPTLCQRLRYDGGHNTSPMEQANEIAVRMNRMKMPMQAIIKTVNGIGKVYALMSEKYVPRRLSEIKGLEDSLQEKSSFGKLKFIRGTYIHNKSEALYEYPKVEDLGTPCIEVINSDIGQSSYTISLCWKYDNEDEIGYIKRYPISHCQNAITNDEIAETVNSAIKDHVSFLKKCKKKYVRVDEGLLEDLVSKACDTVISQKYMRKIVDCIKSTYLNKEVELYELMRSITVIPQRSAHVLNPETQYKLKKHLENVTEIMEAICLG